MPFNVNNIFLGENISFMSLNFNSFITVATPDSFEKHRNSVEHVVILMLLVHLLRIESALDIFISTNVFSVSFRQQDEFATVIAIAACTKP